MMKTEVKIGDKFYMGGKLSKLCEVVDIVKQFSTARQEWCERDIIIARGITTLATNSFEVAKSTVIRFRAPEK